MYTSSILEISDIKSRVVEVLAIQLQYDDNIFTDDKNFIKDLNVDSMDTLCIVCKIEKEFNIRIFDEEVENLNTVGDLISFVEKKL